MNAVYEEIRIALHAIWLRRWLALCVAWAICLVGWLIVALIPNSYESKARVYVNTQSLLEDKVGITQVQAQQDLDRLRQTLASTANLERVVKETDLNRTVDGPRDLAAKITRLRENITVMAQLDPSMIDISATWADSGLSDGANARISQQIVQKLQAPLARQSRATNEFAKGLTFLFDFDGLCQAANDPLQDFSRRFASERGRQNPIGWNTPRQESQISIG